MTQLDRNDLPARFEDAEALEEFMTRPSRALVDNLAALDGDIIVLGIGGKMGPTLARLAKRAAPGKRVVGVARFSEPGLAEDLKRHSVETIACDLLDRAAVNRLPKLPNVIYMAGRKFGAAGNEELLWAMNAHVPALVAEAFHGARIVVFSTGCVYPFVPVTSGGATEATPAVPPGGGYAWSCLAREQTFTYFALRDTTKVCLFRLNYAIDMRYGVLHDVATKVRDGQPIDLTTGHANVIWQGDANAMALRALRHCASPPLPLNITGPETLSIRWLAQAFSDRLGMPAKLEGCEAETGWLNNPARALDLFGYPTVPLARMVDWVADWVGRGQASLGKPTKFEVRSGAF